MYTVTLPPKINLAPIALPEDQDTRFSAMRRAVLSRGKHGQHYLTATDGRSLAIVRVATDGETPAKPALLPTAPLRSGAKGATLAITDTEIRHTDGTATSSRKTTLHVNPSPAGRFPDTAGCALPTHATLVGTHNAIRVDCQRLIELAGALDPERQLILFVAKDRPDCAQPIVVVGANGLGAVMPMTLSDTDLARAQRDYQTATEPGELPGRLDFDDHTPPPPDKAPPHRLIVTT